jgi:hypothetical protein
MMNMQADSKPIQIKNSSTELDLYLLQLDGQAMINHAFLARIRKQLERYNVQLTYDFGLYSHRKHGTTTKYLDGSINITIFKQNVLTVTQGMLAVVHESSHAVAVARGRIIGTQTDEYQAFRREFVFRHKRRPLLKERLALFKLVQQLYANKPLVFLPNYLKHYFG